MHVYIYEMNILVDLMYWIVHEIIIFFFKWAKKNPLNVFIHPSIYCDNHDTRWI